MRCSRTFHENDLELQQSKNPRKWKVPCPGMLGRLRERPVLSTPAWGVIFSQPNTRNELPHKICSARVILAWHVAQ